MASGNGTNAEAIMKHFQNHPDVEVVLLLSNKPKAYALERARKLGVSARVFTREQFNGGEVIHWLKEAGVTHVALAGFLWLLPPALLRVFPDRIINIHPSLLPKHGGKGMYGDKVHQAVKSAGDPRTGITIHLVNEQFDEGKIIFQADCEVLTHDTPETIAARVHALEHRYFPSVIEEWTLGKF